MEIELAQPSPPQKRGHNSPCTPTNVEPERASDLTPAEKSRRGEKGRQRTKEKRSKKKKIEKDLPSSQTKVTGQAEFPLVPLDDSIPIHFSYCPFQGLE